VITTARQGERVDSDGRRASFGHLFRVTTFGESHGPAIGCVVDGCPPKIPLDESDIQHFLDQRRPGQSRFTTQRQEADQVKILSGVFYDETAKRQVTTGTPIALLIENTDQRTTFVNCVPWRSLKALIISESEISSSAV
jgi:chorismate synthase